MCVKYLSIPSKTVADKALVMRWYVVWCNIKRFVKEFEIGYTVADMYPVVIKVLFPSVKNKLYLDLWLQSKRRFKCR